MYLHYVKKLYLACSTTCTAIIIIIEKGKGQLLSRSRSSVVSALTFPSVHPECPWVEFGLS